MSRIARANPRRAMSESQDTRVNPRRANSVSQVEARSASANRPAAPTCRLRQHAGCPNRPAAQRAGLGNRPAAPTGNRQAAGYSERQAAPTGPLCKQAGCGAAPTDRWANRPAAPKHLRAVCANRPAAQRAGCAYLRRQAGSDYPPCAWRTWHGPTERARLRVRTTMLHAYAARRCSYFDGCVRGASCQHPTGLISHLLR